MVKSQVYGREFSVASLEQIHFIIKDMMKNRQKGRVLDIPAGSGRLSWMLHNEGFRVIAADFLAENFINPEIPVVELNMNNSLPFTDESFDYIFCVDGPEHVENMWHTFREFGRVLKPRGEFVFSMPNHTNIECRFRNLFYGVLEPVEIYKPWEKPMGHISRPSYAMINMMLRHAGFEVISVRSEKIKHKQMFFLPLFFVIKLFTWICGQKGHEKYWLQDSNSYKILMGGNGLIYSCKKVS